MTVFYIAFPLKDKNGEITDVFAALIYLNKINKDILDIKIDKNGYGFVINQK